MPKSIYFKHSKNGSQAGYLRQVDVMYGDVDNKDGESHLCVCVIEQAVGHCCGATIVGTLSKHGFWSDEAKVKLFVDALYTLWSNTSQIRNSINGSISLFPVSGFFVYLSEETSYCDKALRKYPGMKPITKFQNKVRGPNYNGNTISLFQLEFK